MGTFYQAVYGGGNMPTIKVAILGFGTVGEGVYRILNEKKEEIKAKTGYAIEVASILVRDLSKERIPTPGVEITDDIKAVFAQSKIDLVFEAIVGKEPTFTYLTTAINQGCDIITANKAMFAKHGATLLAQAEEKGVQVGFEATTAGGVPIIRTVKNLLAGDRVHRIQGILNGTSNFILTKMRQDDVSFEVALQEAQKLGYAEADPTDDVSGKDAFRKLMILSQLAFGKQPSWKSIQIDGIHAVSSKDVSKANAEGKRYRHIAEISICSKGELSGSVGPVLVDADHSLYGVDGVDNAIIVETEYLGALTLIGPGAGMYPTASAMISDLLHIVNKSNRELIPS